MSLKEKRMQKLEDGIEGKSLKCHPRDKDSEGRFMDCKVGKGDGSTEHVGVPTDNVSADINEGTGSWNVTGTRGGATSFSLRKQSQAPYSTSLEVTNGACYETDDDPRGHFCTLNVETKEE